LASPADCYSVAGASRLPGSNPGRGVLVSDSERRLTGVCSWIILSSPRGRTRHSIRCW